MYAYLIYKEKKGVGGCPGLDGQHKFYLNFQAHFSKTFDPPSTLTHPHTTPSTIIILPRKPHFRHSAPKNHKSLHYIRPNHNKIFLHAHKNRSRKLPKNFHDPILELIFDKSTPSNAPTPQQYPHNASISHRNAPTIDSNVSGGQFII